MRIDSQSLPNSRLVKVADVKPARERVFAEHAVQATHHRRIENRGNDAAMHNALITVVTMFHHHFTVNMLAVLEELQPNPIRMAISADKAS
jgi:hypothetical protein